MQNSSFEAWQALPGEFALAYAAQAFHWFAPEQRLSKFSRALRPGGTLAVFGNAGGVAPGALRDAIEAVYEEHAPALAGRDAARHAYGSADSLLFRELQTSDLFTDATCKLTHWQRALSSRDYCALVATFSDHSTLPSTQLQALLSNLVRAIDEHGGLAPLAYTTGLFLARSKPAR